MRNEKTVAAHALGISRTSLYYRSKKEEQDWTLKTTIETVLREHPSYGSRRIAQTLRVNRKRISRVMRKFGILPYRRRRTKWRKPRKRKVSYPNLLLTTTPAYQDHIWAADFTELSFHGGTIYVATVIDLYTRELIGITVSLRKGAQLTLQALHSALLNRRRPDIFHSDNGREYDAQVFTDTLLNLSVMISRIHPGCPWENGYQESFYGKFKVELGDPNQYPTLGELVAAIYRTIGVYNTTRIHSALKMPPKQFAESTRIKETMLQS